MCPYLWRPLSHSWNRYFCKEVIFPAHYFLFLRIYYCECINFPLSSVILTSRLTTPELLKAHQATLSDLMFIIKSRNLLLACEWLRDGSSLTPLCLSLGSSATRHLQRVADAGARDNICGAAIKVTTNKKQHSTFFTACRCAFLTGVITGVVEQGVGRWGEEGTHCSGRGGTGSVKRRI